MAALVRALREQSGGGERVETLGATVDLAQALCGI
jgi:hypothetical protein